MSHVEKELTGAVEEEARRLGADLVGFAPYSRWAKAPVDRSPAGVFPAGRTAVVCAVHFLDATLPDTISPDWLIEAIRSRDRVQGPGGDLTIVERCFTECPAGRAPVSQR